MPAQVQVAYGFRPSPLPIIATPSTAPLLVKVNAEIPQMAVSGNQTIVGVQLHVVQLKWKPTVSGAKQVVSGNGVDAEQPVT